MKFDSFRELLVKKSGNSDLEQLVKFVKDDLLANMVVESLEKMARSKHKGDSANNAMRHFGLEMDSETEPHMIHDALSHHASRYKAAVKAGRSDLANQHAGQIFRMVDMSDQLQKHSQGKLHVEAVSPHAWERHGKTNQYSTDDAKVQEGKYKAGEFKTKTKGWRYRGKNFDFLQSAPHDSYSNEVRRHGHNKAYPMEEIKVNGKHLHIEDVDPEELKGAKGHMFDNHPIMSHFEESPKHRTPERDEQYRKSHDEFHDSDHVNSFWDKHEKMESENPEAYASRGSKASDPVHADVPGLDYEAVRQPGAKPKAAPTKSDSPKIGEGIDTKGLPPHLLRKLGIK